MNLWQRMRAAVGLRSAESWGLLDPRLSAAFGIAETSAGITVNARVAEAQSTIFGCVQAISSAVAQLPVYVYRRDGNARIEQPDHPLMRLYREGPNEHQAWPCFMETLIASTLLRGNGLSEIETDRNGQLTALTFIPWDWVTVQLRAGQRLAFDVFEPYAARANTRRLLPEEVVYLKDRSDDGMIGRSRLARAAEVVGASAAASQFAASFFKNSMNPSGVLETEAAMQPDALKKLQAQIAEGFAGASKAGRIMITSNGLKFKQMSISPEDAELLETRRFSVEELCRIYQVPPPIVQDYTHNTFTNSETAGRWFAQFTIAPWARKIEAAFARAIFGPGSEFEIEFDMSGFLRGDPLQRWQAHQIALANNVLTPNEVRQVEGWNPRTGGDVIEGSTAPEPTIA
jgi:HK97 family phage portal protein